MDVFGIGFTFGSYARHTVVATLLFSTTFVQASPSLFSYQGRILNSQGQPLQSSNVAFEFSITSPDGACIIYKEQRNGVDMQNSNGLFDVPIGSGARSFPAGPSATLLDAFDNTKTHSCNLGGTYIAAVDDVRRLRVKFYDGASWSLITPDIVIRSVPYAGFANTALNSHKLEGKSLTDFVLKDSLPMATCSPTEVVTFDGTGFVCVTDAGGSAGAITSVSGSSPIVVTGTTALTISINVGNGTGTVAAGDDPRFSDMRVPTDNSVTSTKIANGTIGVIDLAPGAADGQVFRFESGSWTHSKLRYTDLINGNNASPWPTAPCVAGEYITWVSVLDGFACTSVTSAAVTTALGYTPVPDTRTVTAGVGLTGGGSLSSDVGLAVDVGTTDGKIPQLGAGGKLPASMLPAAIADGVWESSGGNVYRSTGSVGIGTNNPQSALHVNGVIRATDICDENGVNCKDISTGWGGGASGTVTNVSAAGPLSVVNGTSTPAISISQATTSTDGYLSSTDWNTFNNKLGTATTFSGDVTGTYNATAIANNAVTTAKILDGTITGLDLNFTGLNSVDTGFVMKDNTGKFFNFTCATTGHVPTWTASGFDCQAPSIAETDPQVGANTLNMLSKWDGSALIGSGVYENGGNVGIGTTVLTNLLTLLKTSDAENGIDVRNNSTGSSAAASYYMRNSISSGQFGMASTGHTFAGNISRNRAFLFADTASDGILVITESTDPVILATN